MRITWWPAHCLHWAFNAFPSLPQSSLFKILPTSAASQGRPSCLPCDLQLGFFTSLPSCRLSKQYKNQSKPRPSMNLFQRLPLPVLHLGKIPMLGTFCTSSYSCCLIPYCPFLFPFWVLAISVASHLWWAKSLLERWVHISAAIFLGVQSWQLSPKSLGDPF